MSDRIAQELALLRRHFTDLQYREEGRWLFLPTYRLPPGIWEQETISVCCQFPPGYPGQKPYGFFVSPRLTLKAGGEIKAAAASSEPPFDGEWLKFSWDVPAWHATADLQTGNNMLNFVLTFEARLKEGA